MVSNYTEAIRTNNFPILYLNTILMMLWRIFSSVMFSAMAAYAFARLEFPGRNFLFGLVLFQMMVPPQLFVIPQYLMIDQLGMRNTILLWYFQELSVPLVHSYSVNFSWVFQKNWRNLQNWMVVILGRPSLRSCCLWLSLA